MMSLFFGKLTNPIYKLERLAKILETVRLLQMVIVNHLPSFDLAGQAANFLACQWRHSATAGNALTLG